MGVIHTVFTLVTLALLGVAGYALVVVLNLRLRNPVLRPIKAVEMPSEVKEALLSLVEEMPDAGLPLVSLQHEQRPAGDVAWGVVGCDASGTTWAVAQTDRTLFSRERRVNFVLYSRLANGKAIVTPRRELPALDPPSGRGLTQREFSTVSSQWEVHRESIEAYGGIKNTERIANYEEFRDWRQKKGQRELDALRRKEIITSVVPGVFRFEYAKLHLPAWRGMVEIALWIRAKAGPWALSAKSKAIGGCRLAKAALAEWNAKLRRAGALWKKRRGSPAVVAETRSENDPAPSSAAQAPRAESLADSAPQEHCSRSDLPGSRDGSAAVSSPAPAGAHLETGAVDAQVPPVAPDPAVPYVPAEFSKLMPTEPGLASSPAIPKSRLELYREARSRLSLPGCLGWSVQGMLQCAALVALLLVLFSRGLTDDTTLSVIAGVLILHEIGHGIVMKIAGFRHRGVFFLPVIGWLAAGRKTCVSPRKEFWIHIMGPLPGLVAGWGILIWNYLEPGQPEWLLDGAFWAVLLNTFFLLPFNPLDGGRIADLVFFNRHPYLRVAYYLCGGVALGALYFLSPVLLTIPLVVLAQIPEALRTRRLSGAVRRAVHSVKCEERATLKTFQVIESAGNEKLYRRFAWSATIDRLLRVAASQQLGFFGRACGAAVHLVLLIFPLIVLVAYAVTLRKEQVRGLGEATARIAALEKQVRWVGASPDEPNRRILERMQAAEVTSELEWEGLRRLFDNHGADEDPAEAGMPEPEARAELVALARNLDWSLVGAWIVEREDEAHSRRSLITGIVTDLIEAAKSGHGAGDYEGVERDLSIAYWAIISCEPRHSFREWRRWSMLESDVLVALEELAAERGISAGRKAWFSKSLSNGPRPEGRKLALLLLRDLTEGVMFSGDAYGGRELLEWGEKAGSPVWDPDPAATRAQVAAAAPARMEELGVQFSAEGRNPSHRIRLANVIHHYVTSVLSGKHLPACLKVADQWSRQAEAMPCQPEPGDNLRVIESWNRRLRPILRVNRYRELAAAGLVASRHDPAPGNLAGSSVTMVDGPDGKRPALAVPDPNEDSDPVMLTWRLSPEVQEVSALAE